MSGSSPDSFPSQTNFNLFFLQFIFYFAFIFHMHLCVCVCHVYCGQRTACGSRLVPSGFLGSNSGHLARWQVALVSEPSCHRFLEFIELTLNVLEVSKGPNSRATPKEFSAAC